MADVFISYAREDREIATALKEAIEERGFSVFYDGLLPAGAVWHDEIHKQLLQAGALVVLWSRASVESRNVQDEFREALDIDLRVLPARIEDVPLPFGAKSFHTVDLLDWRRGVGHNEFEALVAGIPAQRARSAELSPPTPRPLSSPPTFSAPTPAARPIRPTPPQAPPRPDEGAAAMSVVELIERKRSGGLLHSGEIQWLVEGAGDTIADYQMASFLMAVYFNGFSADELFGWTTGVTHSGEVMDFSLLRRAVVDMHSTGGVGDKTSIAVAPIVAECGLAVPRFTGRGLGHTGGTLDKVESIPGLRVDLDPEEILGLVDRHGFCIARPFESMVPKDRYLYSLRDATGTVPSLPLLASSIMAKKLAGGVNGVVLDVKVGRGAFMTDVDSASSLAETMIGIGRASGVATVALTTSMDQPLGMEVGNAHEVAEAVAVLRGAGPDDLRGLVARTAEEMLLVTDASRTRASAQQAVSQAIESGRALERLERGVAAQGGDASVISDPSRLEAASRQADLPAPRSGYVSHCDALSIGRAVVRLGGGRARKEDPIDHGVAVTLRAKIGDAVEQGEPLATITFEDPARYESARPLLEGAWEISDDQPGPTPLILGEVR